jgi:hypothetical protein
MKTVANRQHAAHDAAALGFATQLFRHLRHYILLCQQSWACASGVFARAQARWRWAPLVRIFHDGHVLPVQAFNCFGSTRVEAAPRGAHLLLSTGARLSSNLPPRTRSLSIGQVATRYRMTGEPESLVVVENVHGNGVTVYVRETRAVYDERSPAWTLNIV